MTAGQLIYALRQHDPRTRVVVGQGKLVDAHLYVVIFPSEGVLVVGPRDRDAEAFERKMKRRKAKR